MTLYEFYRIIYNNFCADINECQLKPHPCHKSAICFNTDGSFYCECQEGFIGDGLINCTGTSMNLNCILINNNNIIIKMHQPKHVSIMQDLVSLISL